MKKILFISTRNPYSGRYSGDVIRSLKIINLLKKKYHLDVVCLKKNNLNAILVGKCYQKSKNDFICFEKTEFLLDYLQNKSQSKSKMQSH